jgi:uncharacterized RDD family membrane protein YckC
MAKRTRNPKPENLLVSEEAQKLERQLITPEGIPIHFRLAEAGERGAAFTIDSLIMITALALLQYFLSSAISSGDASGWISALVTVLAFFMVNFYFIFFEIRWQGATPGKRIIGLKVVDRSGGQLSADAVVARNFVRWVEIYIPLIVIAAPELFWPGATGYAAIAATLWLMILFFFPLFNADRLRVGDLVAGTIVVERPKTVLMRDLGQAEDAPAHVVAVGQSPDGYTFTEEQLSHYGVYELQVLEELLRKAKDTLEYTDKLQTVFERIAAKIGWKTPRGGLIDTRRFLNDFYSAQRQHLEKQMLLGKKRQDKYSK